MRDHLDRDPDSDDSVRQKTLMRWIVFFVLAGSYCAIVITTLAILLFGFGTLTDSERSVLFGIVIIEAGGTWWLITRSLLGLTRRRPQAGIAKYDDAGALGIDRLAEALRGGHASASQLQEAIQKVPGFLRGILEYEERASVAPQDRSDDKGADPVLEDQIDPGAKDAAKYRTEIELVVAANQTLFHDISKVAAEIAHRASRGN